MAFTTRPSMGLRQAPQIGTPILSWHGRQYSSPLSSRASAVSSLLHTQQQTTQQLSLVIRAPQFNNTTFSNVSVTDLWLETTIELFSVVMCIGSENQQTRMTTGYHKCCMLLNKSASILNWHNLIIQEDILHRLLLLWPVFRCSWHKKPVNKKSLFCNTLFKWALCQYQLLALVLLLI